LLLIHDVHREQALPATLEAGTTAVKFTPDSRS
jgi:hypothetical protein